MSTDQHTRVAKRLRPFGTTIFTEITKLANEHDAVNLGQGFPDFEGPALGKQAVKDALDTGWNQYTPLPGVPELRASIARWWRDATGVELDEDAEITVTTGCTEAIAATLLGLVNEGDEVILCEPYYDSYRASVAMAGATPKFVTIREINGRFTIPIDELRAAITPRTRMLVLNTPHNPTGSVLTRDELAAIAALCVEHDLIVLSDEVYERLTYDDAAHVSISTIPGMRERTVVASSIGKTFSFTGWKLGWTIAPPELTKGVRSAHQFLTFCVPGPIQYGAAAMLDNARAEVDELRAHLQSMRDLLLGTLRDVGFRAQAPQGSYFIMADHTAVSAKLGIDNDVDMCRWLIEHAGVASIPPSAFYEQSDEGTRYLRFSFAKKRETIDEAVRRLRAALG